MVLTYMDKNEIILDDLQVLRTAIDNLREWNKTVDDFDELLKSPQGMQDLAGNCMVIMAIGEGFKKIDKYTDGQLLAERPEIPWQQVFGLRNRIAHGYFDLDAEIIGEVIKNDLQPLLDATNYFIAKLSEI